MRAWLALALAASATVDAGAPPAFEMRDIETKVLAAARPKASEPFALRGHFELAPDTGTPFTLVSAKAVGDCAAPPEGRIFQDGFE